MKARDTVMNYRELVEKTGHHNFTPAEGREAQAEISFKAGKQEAIIEYGDHLVAEGKKAGQDSVFDSMLEGLKKNRMHSAPTEEMAQEIAELCVGLGHSTIGWLVFIPDGMEVNDMGKPGYIRPGVPYKPQPPDAPRLMGKPNRYK